MDLAGLHHGGLSENRDREMEVELPAGCRGLVVQGLIRRRREGRRRVLGSARRGVGRGDASGGFFFREGLHGRFVSGGKGCHGRENVFGRRGR